MAPRDFYVDEQPWQKVHDLSVWIVDGDKIRNQADVKFTNAGEHHQYPKLIPKNELWISDKLDKAERPFLRDFLLTLHREMSEGKSYTEAEKVASETEAKERERVEHVKRAKAAEKVPASAFGKIIRRWPDGVTAKWVDGRLIRNRFVDEYTEGGHDLVYHSFPTKVIGIDDAGTDEADLPFILIHEKRERNLMEGGMTYNQAHAKANVLERYARKHIGDVEAILKRLGEPRANPLSEGSISGGKAI